MAETGEQTPTPANRAPWWGRWWMIVIWVLGGVVATLLALVVIGISVAEPEVSAPAAPSIPTPVPLATAVVQASVPPPIVAGECLSAEEWAYFDKMDGPIDRIRLVGEDLTFLLGLGVSDPQIVEDINWRLKLYQLQDAAEVVVSDVRALRGPPSVQGIQHDLDLSVTEYQIGIALIIEGTAPLNEDLIYEAVGRIDQGTIHMEELAGELETFCD